MAKFIRRNYLLAVCFLSFLTFSCWCFLNASDSTVVGQPSLVRPTSDVDVWSVEIKKGENYLSLPLIPYKKDIQSLFGHHLEAVDEVAWFDKVNGTWVSFAPQIPPQK